MSRKIITHSITPFHPLLGPQMLHILNIRPAQLQNIKQVNKNKYPYATKTPVFRMNIFNLQKSDLHSKPVYKRTGGSGGNYKKHAFRKREFTLEEANQHDSSTFHSSRPKDCVGASSCCVINEEVTFDRTRVRYDLTNK